MVVLYDLFSVDFKYISAWVRVVASDYGDVEGKRGGRMVGSAHPTTFMPNNSWACVGSRVSLCSTQPTGYNQMRMACKGIECG